jgi:Protein of unknown function (DUF2877)
MHQDLATPQRVSRHECKAFPWAQTAVASTAIADLLAAAPQQARLLGASRFALYLGLDASQGGVTIIAVLAPDAVRLPLGLVIAGSLPDLSPTSTASVGGGEVSVGPLAFRPTRWFDPRPRLDEPFQMDRIDAAGRLLGGLPAGAHGLPDEPVDTIATCLINGDPTPALRVIGRGPGLTPAGDDVVAGALAAIALRGRLPGGAAGAVLAHAVSATTSLSSSLLFCAAAGQVVPQAARFLAALCGAAPLDSALDDLRAVGGTSGTALAIGLVAGARAAVCAPQEATL